MDGYLQIYTGDGKGKSTAAFGLAIRARGAGLKVVVLQFIKNKTYSEHEMLRKAGVEVRQYGCGLLFGRPPRPEDFESAARGLEEVRRMFSEASADVLILDEVNIALSLGLAEEAAFLSILDTKPPSMEVVCTGRRAPEKLLERADLITEMKAVRHYYESGVPARTGIEK